MRGTETLDAATFLVNQNWGVTPKISRIASVRARNCRGASTLRVKRMTPQGSALRRNELSALDKAAPAIPVMDAEKPLGPRASSNIAVSVENQLLGTTQVPPAALKDAQNCCASCEDANGPTMVRSENTFRAQIRTSDDGRFSAKLVGKFGLQTAERGTGFRLGLLRGELHKEPA